MMKKKVLCSIVVLLLAVSGLAHAAEIFIGGTSTDWLDDTNWDSGISPGNDATVSALYITAEVDHTAAQGTTTETNDFHVGTSAGEGILNLLGGSIIVDNSWGVIIGQQGVGTVNIDGGSLILQNDKPFRIGNGGSNGNGTINLISGLLQVATVDQNFEIGRDGATGLLDISGGTAIFASAPIIANGSINFADGSTGSLTIAGADQAYYESIYGTGLTYDSVSGSAFGDVFSVTGGTITTVPEPATMVLLGLGGLISLRPRRA